MTEASPFDPDDLMRHEAFVRELARRLVYDAQAAEDVAQQTWLAVLQAPVRPLHSVRAWLATIVRRTAHKRTGSEQSRRRRDEVAAPREPAPSAAEIVEREQARAAVVQALLSLPENYRDVVVLRWFEGLPPRDVARRLGVPVETVRTRHRRAMEQLRNELDRRAGGDRSAWAAMLLPLLGPDGVPLPAATAAATTLTTGVLLMSTKLKLVAAIAVALAVTTWLSWPPAVRPPQASASNTGAANATVATVPADQQAGGVQPIATDPGENVAGTFERELAAEAPTTGAVEVHVTWAADGLPAAEVAVMVAGEGVREMLTTDATGTARLAAAAPGTYLTNIMRPNVMWFEPELQQPRFEVTAGATTEIDLVVPESLGLHGIVVDGNARPIAGAEIVMGGGFAALVMARSDDTGRFTVRDVATRCEVGARAPGLAPSPLRKVQGSKGGSVELRFVLDQPGARVAGIVVGPDAEPVTGARVMVGSHHGFILVRLADGAWGQGPPRSVAHTDEHGHFSMPSVTPGTVPITVVAAGFAPHHGELVLAPGSSHDITVRMLPGVTVRGVVRSTKGAAIASALITTSRRTDLMCWAQTAADGSYEIVDAAIGELTIEVECDAFDSTSAILTAAAGQTLTWNPVLASPGIALHGRLLDADEHPVPDAQVSASRSLRHAGTWSRRHNRTDAEGRFEVPNCEPGIPLYLEARVRDQRSEVRLEAVLPEDGEHVMRLPKPSSVFMRGIVLDDNGRPLPNVAVWAAGRHGSRRTTNDLETGAFALGPHLAGSYKIWIRADGFMPFDSEERTLADQETWDLGELRLQRSGKGGTLRVALIGDQALEERYVTIRMTDGDYRQQCEVTGGMAVSDPLTPGDHLLQVEGADVAAQVVPFTIREGRETRLDVPLHRGPMVTVRFEPLDGAPLPVCVQMTVTRADGAPVLRRDVWLHDGAELAHPIMLRPGKYRVEATTEQDELPARVGSAEFEVGTEPMTQRVELAPLD